MAESAYPKQPDIIRGLFILCKLYQKPIYYLGGKRIESQDQLLITMRLQPMRER